MMRRLENLLHIIGMVSAASFWAVVLTIAGLSFSGRITSDRWAATGRVLRGELETIPRKQLLELTNAQAQLQEIRENITLQRLEETVRDLAQLRRDEEARLSNERTRLTAWHDWLVARQRQVETDIKLWQTEKDRRSTEIQAEQALAQVEADKRLFAIYGQMEPGLIALDLQTRYRLGAGEAQEAVRILTGLSERKAAEVLQEMNDPALRARLISDMTAYVAKTSAAGSAP